MEEIWDFIQENILNTEKCQWCLANQRCSEVNYSVSDYVWLFLQDYSIKWKSYAFELQQAGLFTILKQVGNLYQLKLPYTMQIHLMFSLDKLWKMAMNSLSGQQALKLEPIKVDGNVKWERDKILAI